MTWSPNLLGEGYTYHVIFLITTIILALRYTSLQTRYYSLLANPPRNGHPGPPPTFPYFIPFLGTLPIGYLLNPIKYILNPNSPFQSPHPIHIHLLHHTLTFLHTPSLIATLFKNSHLCTSTILSKYALGYAFGLSPAALKLYTLDDSGGGTIPHPDSVVEPRNRIDFRDHQSLVRGFEGKGLAPFWSRYEKGITERFGGLWRGAGEDGEMWGDLMARVGDESLRVLLEAMCGKHLLRLNPGFVEDFWGFDGSLQVFLQGVPRVLARGAYECRDRVLGAVRRWQEFARREWREELVGTDGDDEVWGSAFFRERQGMFLGMEGYEVEDVASNDFGAIWASRNAIAATSWVVLELYRDPDLLAAIRAEVDSCVTSNDGGNVQFDTDKLFRLPVLQAVYAETLRLRMHFYIIRMPDRVNLNIKDWILPRRRVIVTLTTVAHMDSKAWNTGVDIEHPVDTFWPGRFLHYHSDATEDSVPIFSTKNMEGSWIPYGGGPRQCPGRHFAKRQIMYTAALMVALFDCEILGDGKNVKEDLSLTGFGGGVSRPVGKVPVRMRRRKATGYA